MPYSANRLGVVPLCQEILKSGTDFSGTTVPTSDQVDAFLVDASLYIDTEIASLGFDVPIAGTETEIVSWLVPVEELIAASMVYLTRFKGRPQMQDLDSEGEGESSVLFRQAKRRLDAILKNGGAALMAAGLTKTSESGAVHLTARLVDDKDTLYDDADVVQPRFKRDQFRRV